MRPAKQGKLDGLCGIYSIINAIELVGVTGRQSSLHRGLFNKLISGLTPHQLRAALVVGLETDELIGASRRAFRWLRKSHGVDLRIRRPFEDHEFDDGQAYVEAVRAQASQWRRAVIMCISLPGNSHWTVVRSVEGRRVYLRDSGRLTHIDTRRFDLAKGRYRYFAEDTLVIQRRL